jgi:hypothetical protein
MSLDEARMCEEFQCATKISLEEAHMCDEIKNKTQRLIEEAQKKTKL